MSFFDGLEDAKNEAISIYLLNIDNEFHNVVNDDRVEPNGASSSRERLEGVIA